MQSADWTATSSSASGTHLTDDISLAAGTYLMVFNTPKPSAQQEMGIYLSSVGWLGWITVPQNQRASGAFVTTISESHTIHVGCGSSASTTYTETSGAKFMAVRLA